MDIRENLAQIGEEMKKELEGTDALQALEALRVKVLGKKGSLTALLRGMSQLSPEDRPKVGQIINEAREKLTALLDEKQAELSAREKAMRLQAEAIDVTEPRDLPEIGAEHPMNLVLREVLDSTQVDASSLSDPELAARMASINDVMKYSIIVVGCIPMLLVYPFIKKYFEKGMMIGSIKG